MASAALLKEIQEIATCFLCSKLLDMPMSLDCEHSYCEQCLLAYCGKEVLLKKTLCPQCQLPTDVESWRYNNHLERILKVLRKLEETHCELKCEEHRELLRRFCEDDKRLICQPCVEAPEHKGHTTVLLEDACRGYKKKLQKAMARLNDLQTKCMNQKTYIRTQITTWQKQIASWKQKVKWDFEKVHTFLREEEKLCLWRLEKEEEQMLRRLRENEAKLQKKSEELKCHILELEAKCQSSAQKLLQDVEGTLSRACAVKLEAPEVFSLEVQTTCDVAKLYLDVKAKLRHHQVTVTLDPDTAHPILTLSEDQRRVSFGCSQQNLADSSGRFTTLPCVLGCEGFTSGRHYFEVDVGEGKAWDVGVCMENVKRGTDMIQEPEGGFWAIRLYTENCYAALTLPHTVLKLPEQPLVVGVVVDYEAGAVSFYNMTSGSHIFTFPKASFSGTLRPFFQVYPGSPLFLPFCTV